MKPLDIVKTPKGNIAIISETNNCGGIASIWFFGEQNPDNEKNAWWDKKELEVIDNFPRVLSLMAMNPFGAGEEDAEFFFGRGK